MSCGEVLPQYEEASLEVTHETDYLEIGTDFENPVCAGNLKLMDEQVEFVAQVLEHELNGPFSVSWYEWYTDIEACSESAMACTKNNGNVYTNWDSMAHELVHAVANEVNPDAPPVFAEGLAVMLEGVTLGTPFALSEVIAHENVSSVDYEGLGHFTRWLIDTYGIDAYLTAYEAAEWSDDIASSQNEAFRLAYGKEWSELVAEHKRDAPDYFRGLGPFEICATDDVLPWNGERWEHTITVDCASDSTIARLGNLNQPEMWRRVAIEIPETGRYRFEFNSEYSAVAAQINACMSSDSAMEGDLPLLDDWTVDTVWGEKRRFGLFQWVGWPANLGPFMPGHAAIGVWFEPGKYIIWVGAKGVDPADISVSIWPEP